MLEITEENNLMIIWSGYLGNYCFKKVGLHFWHLVFMLKVIKSLLSLSTKRILFIYT